MKVTRLYTGPDGESHFEDTDIPLEDNGGISRRSEIIKATGIIFVEVDSVKQAAWHNAPRRQFVVHLEGETEVEIGDGTKRLFRPGNVVLAEDTKGRGHITRGVNNQPRKMAFIVLD